MNSPIHEFYKNKTAFITGGTGFLGKVLIEKLLRTTEVKRIYVLIRTKRGVEIQKRLEGWNTEPLFEKLLKLKPNIFERVVAVAGDCCEPNLGISEADIKQLKDEVQIVWHGAASVKFTDPLNEALKVNTRAVVFMIQLAKQMNHLESIVHVSTAYSNCVLESIEERFYPECLPYSYDKVLAMTEKLDNYLVDKITPALLGKHPNTYTFTKALGEHVVQMEAGDLPLCIFRPGVIFPSYREPIIGWIDNINGPIGILYGIFYGVLRLILVDLKVRTQVVPVDYSVNVALVSAWQTAVKAAKRKEQAFVKSPSPPPTIYHFVPSNKNPLSWGHFKKIFSDNWHNYALEQMVWYPFVTCTAYSWLFKIGIYIYHWLPGLLMDIGLRLKGQEPRLLKLYGKIHDGIYIISHFSLNNLTFHMRNTEQLELSMSEQDRKVYGFDMNNMDWNDFIIKSLIGVRKFIAKEDPTPDSCLRAGKIFKKFKLYHRILQIFIYCISVGILLWLIIYYRTK